MTRLRIHDPEPDFVMHPYGGELFCHGCKMFFPMLLRVSMSRYRCSECASSSEVKRPQAPSTNGGQVADKTVEPEAEAW